MTFLPAERAGPVFLGLGAGGGGAAAGAGSGMVSATVETRNAMGFKALDNLEAFLLRGQTPPDLVKAS